MRLMICVVSAATLLLTSVPASAEPVAYEIDASHTHVQFSVTRFGFNQVIGEFQSLSGRLMLEEERPDNSSVSVVIDTTSLESGDDVRNGHISGEFWFDVANHPEITFVSTSVDVTGENAAMITGDLTIKGITQSVMLDAVLNRIGNDPAMKKKAAGFSATTMLRRSDFGISIAENLIGDEVAIRIELLAHQAD